MGLLLNHKHKFGFVHIPKTRGTTITSLLLQVSETEELTSHHGLSLLPDDNSYFYFTVVRNPYTRLLSAYKHECRKFGFKEFDKFLNDVNEDNTWYVPQTFFTLGGVTTNRKFSRIIKYENYEQDILPVLNLIQNEKEFKSLPHLNCNPIYEKHPKLNQQKYYKHLYTETWMKDWVRERYKNDFKVLNYGMDI